MSQFAVDLSDHDDDTLSAFLKSHSDVMDEPDDQARRRYLGIENAAGMDRVQCPFCSLNGQRSFLVRLHVIECCNRFQELCVDSVVGRKRRHSDLEVASNSTAAAITDVSTSMTPAEEFHRFVDQQPTKIDPGQCLFDNTKHPGVSRIQNRAGGINVFTPNFEELRICCFSHFTKLEEAKQVWLLLNEAIRLSPTFPGTHLCTYCQTELACIMRVTVGSARKKPPNVIKEMFFCKSSCFSKFLETFATLGAWSNRVKEWKN
jgi:hypothetical protein